jgi:site-specific recombinase XerD
MEPEYFTVAGYSGLTRPDLPLGKELQRNIIRLTKKLNCMNSKHSFSILVWVLRYRLKNGKAPLSIRITVNGERAEILANREITFSLWDSKAQRVKGTTEEARSINAHLETIKGSLRMHESRLIALGKTVTAELLKNEYLGLRPDRHSLCTAFEIHIKRMTEKVKVGNKAPATLDKYGYTFGKVKAFLNHHYKVSDIYLEDIKRSFIHDFEHYMFTVEHLQNNTVMKYLRQTKTVLKMAVEMGWLPTDPTSHFRLSFEDKAPIRLEMDELINLATKEIPIARLAEARDCYVFMCYTGYAYEDAFGLGSDNIFIGIDGQKWITKDRQKTEEAECVPLLPVPLEVMKRYRHHPYCSAHGKLLPVRSNQRFNGYLKEIAAICGINKELTTHTARHTFATTVTLENDVPMETVSKMLGHRSIKTTQRYAKVTRKKISQNMNALKEKLAADGSQISPHLTSMK